VTSCGRTKVRGGPGCFRKEFITIDDLHSYKRARVQLHAQGILLKDEIPGALIKTKRQQVIRAGEFLVAEIDAKVGGFGIVPQTLEGAIVSSHYFVFQSRRGRLSERFLGWITKAPAFRQQVEAQGSTNYAAIRPNDVLGYRIPLPSLDDQRIIVERIDDVASKLLEAQTLRAASLLEIDALRRTHSRQLFGSLSESIIPLEEACLEIVDNLHTNPQYSETGTVPCIRSPDVGYGELDLDSARKTDEHEYSRRTVRGEPQTDDIVLVREGGGTGKCAIVRPGQKFSLGQRVMMLRPKYNSRATPFLFVSTAFSSNTRGSRATAIQGVRVTAS
jgi:type I restriction enzyme S subunit